MIGHGVSAHFLDQAPRADFPRGEGILFCGTWTGVKGVDYLVAAFTQLLDGGVRVPLTILGPGVSEEAVCSAFPTHVRSYLRIIDRVGENEVELFTWEQTNRVEELRLAVQRSKHYRTKQASA